MKPPIISPVFGKMDLKTLAGWMLQDNINARLQVQLHKLVWGPERTRRLSARLNPSGNNIG